MNHHTPLPGNDRLLELLAAYALGDISSDERDDLASLLDEQDGIAADEFETAAAALHVAMTAPESMPAHIRQRVEGAASAFFDQGAGDVPPEPKVESSPGVPIERWQFHPREAIAWLAAIAAAVFLMIGGNNGQPAPDSSLPTPSAESSLAELRAELMEDSETVSLKWGTTPEPDPTAIDVTGDIVWNKARQEGFMKFTNLVQNNPSEFQYQLWIFDRNQKDPIDGGVFDISKDEVIVQIDPKLAVVDAFQFAVTIEKPGGVVRSDKERIAVLAAL